MSMHHYLEKHPKTNIFKKPNNTQNLYDQITIGDLHGNAIKLLFFLIKEGVYDISKTDYGSLVDIYIKNLIIKIPLTNKEKARNQSRLRKFKYLINKLKLKNKASVRLIGDEVADRGQNDFFTLLILEKLHEDKVPFEILISNHGLSFIESIENHVPEDKTLRPVTFNPGTDFINSLFNLSKLIENETVSIDEILSITYKCYMPSLKLLSYDLNQAENCISLYSHAPIDLKIIKNLANVFELSVMDDSPINLARTIDSINQKTQGLFEQGIFYQSCIDIFKKQLKDNSQQVGKPNPLFQVMHNRNYNILNRTPTHQGYNVNYVHGHDHSGLADKHIFKLDSLLGKVLTLNRGCYLSLVTKRTLLAHEIIDNSQTKSEINQDLFPYMEDIDFSNIVQDLFLPSKKESSKSSIDNGIILDPTNVCLNKPLPFAFFPERRHRTFSTTLMAGGKSQSPIEKQKFKPGN